MKIRILVLLIVLTVIPTISFCFTSPQKQQNAPVSTLKGVWRLSEIVPPGSSGSTNSSPQPGIYIFTEHYLSHNAVSSGAPRPLLPNRRLTDKEFADNARPFLASAGTYEVKGDQITIRIIVALNPNYMRSEYSRIYSYRFVGRDTLWLTETTTGGVAIKYPPMLKLTRLE